MSLTSEIRDPDSPIRAFFEERFPNAGLLLEEWRSQVEGLSTLEPPGSVHHSTIGTAIDYRIRFYFGLGKLVAHHGIALLVASSEVHAPLQETSHPWQTLASGFLAGLTGHLQQAQPIGRRLDREDEDELCRYCYVLALFEQLYRAGLSVRSPLYTLGSRAEVKDLLQLASGESVEDLRQLSWGFYDTQQDLLMEDAILNPTFEGSLAIGGADADVIVDRCLVEIKSTVNPRRMSERSWPWQLLGYVLLDLRDEYIIHDVGVYLARQTTLIRWPLRKYMSILSGDLTISLGKSREAFRSVLEQLAASRPSLSLILQAKAASRPGKRRN